MTRPNNYSEQPTKNNFPKEMPSYQQWQRKRQEERKVREEATQSNHNTEWHNSKAIMNVDQIQQM